MRRTVSIAAVACAAALAITAVATPAAAAGVATVTVWHWNVAGNTMHDGSTTDGMIDSAVSSIRNRSATFASFNELCKGQYNALVTALRAAGWPQDSTNFARFEPSLPASSGVCNGNEEYGNAIFSRQPLGSADRLTLPSDGRPEQRNMLCAPVRDTPHLRFCTTHITTSNATAANGLADNVNQLNAVLDRMETYRAAGDTAMIAGDFNAQPHYGRLNNWYSTTLDTPYNAGNTGSYRELDDNDTGNCLGYGEWTATGTPGAVPPCSATQAQAKIDLIFVRDDRLAGAYSGDSLSISTACTGIPATADYPAGSCSDHRILIGTATVTTG